MLVQTCNTNIIYSYMTQEDELYSKAVETGIEKFNYSPQLNDQNSWYIYTKCGKEVEGLTRIEVKSPYAVNIHFFMQKKDREDKFIFANEILEAVFKHDSSFIKAYIEFPSHRKDIIKFLDVLGFKREGRLSKCCMYEHYIRDALIYGISKKDFINKGDS